MSKISNLERSISDLEQKISKEKHALEVMESKLASLRNHESSQMPHQEGVNAVSSGGSGLLGYKEEEVNAVSSGGSGLFQKTEYFSTGEESKANGLSQLNAISFNKTKSTGDVQQLRLSTPSTEVINRLVAGVSKLLAGIGKGFVVQYHDDEDSGYKFLFKYKQDGAPTAMVRLQPGGWLYNKEQKLSEYLSLDEAKLKLRTIGERATWDQWNSTVACVIAAFMLSSNEIYPVDSGSRKDGRGGGLRTTLNNLIKEEFS